MERKRMDAEGGLVVHRDRRSRKLAVVVALQNLLVVSCLLTTFYVYWNTEKQPAFEDNTYILFEPIGDVHANKMVQLHALHSKNINVVNGKIYINCTGPYILYMDVCYMSMRENETTGMLQLKVEGNDTPAVSIDLETRKDKCKGLHGIAYLKAKQVASLYFNSTDGFKVKNATMGLSYLLGRQCEF